MLKLWKCSVCGFIWEGEDAPEKCPKCDAPQDKFTQLNDEDANKIRKSDRTNDIHMRIISLSAEIISLCKEGIDIKLDPACVSVFERAKNDAWIIKQRSKAELIGHMNKGKF